MKLAGSTLGASTNTLLSSALALCYSAAEYCAPVWSCSAHTSQVDVQLKLYHELISGTLHSTPLPRLPVLSNIEPPALQRKAATGKLVEKIMKHDSWSIQPDVLNSPFLQMTSRKPLWLDSTKPFSHRTGALRYLQKEMATCRHWSVSLRRDSDDVPHRRILAHGRATGRNLSSLVTNSHQLWASISASIKGRYWDLCCSLSTVVPWAT